MLAQPRWKYKSCRDNNLRIRLPFSTSFLNPQTGQTYSSCISQLAQHSTSRLNWASHHKYIFQEIIKKKLHKIAQTTSPQPNIPSQPNQSSQLNTSTNKVIPPHSQPIHFYIPFQKFYKSLHNYNQPRHKMIPDSPKTMQSIKMFRSKYKNKRKNKKTISLDDYPHQVYDKFLRILNRRRENFLKEHLVEYFGKNFPINYKKHYHFQEQWENKLNYKEKIQKNVITDVSNFDIAVSVATIIVYLCTIWLTNIDFFFRGTGKIEYYYEVYSFSIAVTLLNIILRNRFTHKEQENNARFREFIKAEYLTVITIVYLILKLAGVNSQFNAGWLIFQSFILVIFYRQASKRYQSLRLMSFSLQYEYQTKVADMIITVFIIAHLISIILFSTTKLNPDNNWMTPLNIDKNNQYILYLHSFYFCTTTIMTVGYGDITPKNPQEVFVVILIQIFGVIMLGYIINQIGYCISSLRKDQQAVEKDLSIVEKIKKHYRMNQQLSNKVRSYIVNSKPNINQLSPDQEKGILVKLNEEIRADMVKQNMISIVKSSVFFLCRWTSHFQQSISSKLVHILINPNDILYQPTGNQRIYIIKSGKINVHVGRSLGKKRLHNVLKTISITLQNQVSDNCYGYTSVISIRPAKLFAISTNFASAYYIDREKFMESIHERIPDLQFYHELKSKIDQARLCQSIEIHRLQSSKHHYNPTKSYIIKKQLKLNFIHQERETHNRRATLAFRGTKNIFNEEMMKQVRNNFCGSFASFGETNLYEDIDSHLKEITEVHISRQNDQLFKHVMELDVAKNFDHFFQSSKEYNNYFSKNNRSQILKRLEKEFFMQNYESMQSKHKDEENTYIL